MDLIKEEQWLEKKETKILEDAVEQIRPVVKQVRESGDAGVKEFTEKFDNVEIKDFEVTEEEKQEALDALTSEEETAIRESAERIERFHKKQTPEEWSEEFTEDFEAGEIVRPLESIGCYVPGGNYPLPSSALMTVIPAKVAGVEETVVCTPPDETGDATSYTVAAAEIAGADRIFKIGGAQAIAAMGYGTEQVPKVQKIVGPGNKYVTAAKKLLYGETGIDFLAGPSEVLIISDGTSKPENLAADLLAQAEHDKDAAAILITTDEEETVKVEKELEKQLEQLPTSKTAAESLKQNSGMILAENLEEAIQLSNQFAPEHLEIQTQNPKEKLEEVKNAGTVLLGEKSVEALGDYTTGTNHVLPTGGAARYRGGLSVRDYVKTITWEKQTSQSIKQIGQQAINMAKIETLPAHKKSIQKRTHEEKR